MTVLCVLRSLKQCLLGFCITLVAVLALAEDNQLGSGDQVKITAVDQTDMSAGRKEVRADGSLQLPRMGSVEVEGLTIEEATKRIKDQMQSVLGLSKPDIVFEIVDYRPFYVSGSVEAPGSHAYVPTLTVLQAIALAGGHFRPQDQNVSTWLEVARTRKCLEQSREQATIALMRKSRFMTERNQSAFTVSEEAYQYAEKERVLQ